CARRHGSSSFDYW
nr:immunoglobulin heavy chain junction region [Mus musculus]NSM05533.1 immunoglobulin heavy chain junction region [Mus musculus]NSM05546.1 immunoglobulin heavy chain junction region [Mus musculus]NSM06270.1 immunoglobulin heavy chain junction region [Mus musculus]NSM08953.1 immunoglobulin heavy chain junction region [Mus musculus]